METQIVDLILGPLGTLVLALVIIVTGMKCKWVFGWQYKKLEADKDEWKQAALRGTYVAERATQALVQHAEKETGNG